MKARVNVIKESYKHYRFKNDRYKVSADYGEYSLIANKFFEKLFEKIVKTGLMIDLPSKLGSFIIEQYNTAEYIESLEKRGKKYRKRDRISEKLYYQEYGKVVEIHYDDSETDGKMWTFSWVRSKNGTFKNKHMYSFNLVRSNVRSSSNKVYSEKSKRLTVHDYYKEEGYKIYRNLIIPYKRNQTENVYN